MASGSVLQKSPGSHTYSYSSQPRAAPQRRKYREENFKEDDRQVLYGNIMYDRRIVRGNTYALTYPTGASKPDPLEQQRNQEARRRAQARRRAKEQMRVRSPDPVEGRKHIDVQTELYLEEITDRIEEADVQTQTDAFLNRPATPLFIPAKTGADVATQIEEGDLFDFDIEVKPILEVLVGKTVEQALMEVMEEEELASLRAQQREFEENRNAELVETQRLEEQERRHREEKERRMHQQREALLKEKETSEKIAARAFAQSYLNDLVPSVFSILHDSGYFYDTTEREIETTFMPWLMEQTSDALQKQIIARMMVDAMVKEIVKKKMGIKPESSSLSENAEGNEDAPESKQVITEAGDGDAPESKRVVTEAGQDENESQADKAEPTADSQGTEEKEPSVEKSTDAVPDDQSSKDTTVEDKTEPKTKPAGEQQATEEQKESEEQKEAEVPPTQPPESEAKPVIVEDTTAEETTSSEAPASSEEPKVEATSSEEPKTEEGKDEVPKDEEPKEEQPKEEQPQSEQPKQEQPTDEQPKEEQPKDQEQPQEDSN